MPNIAVYFDEPEFDAAPFDDPVYRTLYGELAAAIADRGGFFSIVRGPDTYLGGSSFTGGWVFSDSGFVRRDRPIEADMLYVKGTQLRPDPHAPVVNHPGLDSICSDKIRMCRMFPDIFPTTIVVADAVHLPDAVRRIPTDRIVLKPADGYGGEGIVIVFRDAVDPSALDYPLVAQEFIETSAGIPGLAEGRHDLRLLVADGHIVGGAVRVPAEGKLLANVALGGSIRGIAPDAIPEDAAAFVARVDPVLAPFGHRLYSVDCCRDASGNWFVLELNDQPGLLTRQEAGADADRFFAAIAEFFLTAARHAER